MAKQRTDRLNSLLKEVISEVIRRDVNNPSISEFITITRVDITKDLHQAKVYVSIIATEQEKSSTLDALNSAAGFISVIASKKVVMRFFPTLTFKIDDTVNKQMRIDELLHNIQTERNSRTQQSPENGNDNTTFYAFLHFAHVFFHPF